LKNGPELGNSGPLKKEIFFVSGSRRFDSLDDCCACCTSIQKFLDPCGVQGQSQVNRKGTNGYSCEEDGNADRRFDHCPDFSVDHVVLLLFQPRGINVRQQMCQRSNHSKDLSPLDEVPVNFF